MNTDNKIYSLHYMRGIACILVVLFHFRGAINGVYAQKDLGDLLFLHGAIGVDLFFMISGFIIAYATQKKESQLSFFSKRFFRIYPVYITCLLILFTITSQAIDINFIKSIFFIHLNYNDHAPVYGYTTIFSAWTLTYEIAFYALFMLAMTASHKYRVALSIIFIFSLNFGLQSLFNNGEYNLSAATSANYNGPFSGLIKIYSSPMMTEFAIGLIIYSIHKHIGFLKNINNKYIFNISISIGISYVVYCYMSGYGTFIGPKGYGLISLVLFSCIIMWESIYGIKKNTILDFFGNISYSLYLTHIVIHLFFRENQSTIPLLSSATGFSKLFIMAAMSILLSYVLYIAIERPFIKIGRELLNKKLKNEDTLVIYKKPGN